MNRYSNNESYNSSNWSCQCPYRDTCERYGYRESNYYNGTRNERRNYREREFNSCSICNIFRRWN